VIKAIAIDDEPLPLEILEAYCSNISFLKLEKTFTQTGEAKKYLQKHPIDLIFLDIHMPAISGIDFYKDIEQDTMVIFTTAHSQYAIEGFNLSAVDYLLKPYSQERFEVAVNKAHEYYNFLNQKESREQKHIFIRAEYSLVKIPTADIIFIEGLADYLKIHLQNGKTILTRMTMKTMLSKLSPKEFIRVHRSYIVPFKLITGVRNKIITLGNNQEIPIGASFEEAFFEEFKNQ
jgi:DNA-binding LytR/AlgR family response regulator